MGACARTEVWKKHGTGGGLCGEDEPRSGLGPDLGSRCPPCHAMAPNFRALAATSQGQVRQQDDKRFISNEMLLLVNQYFCYSSHSGSSVAFLVGFQTLSK